MYPPGEQGGGRGTSSQHMYVSLALLKLQGPVQHWPLQ